MLLRNLPQPEFPSGYLLPRLLARKAAGAADVQACLEGKQPLPWATAQDIAGRSQAERVWLYHQLNSRLRHSLAPVFLFFELKSLVNGVRLRRARASADGLDFSPSRTLLCPELQKLLQTEEEAPVLTKRLEALLCARLAPGFSGLAAVYAGQGIAAFERRLYELFFAHLGLVAPEAGVRSFFKDIVDLRNILALAKAHYWQEPMTFLAGGHLEAQWEKALAEPERAGRLLATLHWESGLPQGIAELSGLEDFLLRRQALILQRRARSNTVAQILHYLWQQDLLARNRGLLFHCRLAGEELCKAKVIQ